MDDKALSDGDADLSEVFALVRDLTQLLLNWSWEGIVGLEDKVKRAARAYGHDAQIVMSAESAIVRVGDREALLRGFPGIPPLAALLPLKTLLHEIETGAVTPTEAQIRLADISSTKQIYPGVLRVLGVSIMSFGFAIDIIGTWEACLVGALTGVLAGVLLLWSERSVGNAMVVPLVASFVVAGSVMLVSKFGLVAASPGLLMIPAMFVFIPGDSIAMQAVELIDGRWTAGTARFFYSLVMLIMLTAGVVLAAAATGTSYSAVAPGPEGGNLFSWWAPYPGHIVFTIGTALAFQMRWRDVYLATFVTLMTTAVAQLASMAFGALVGTFGASVVMVLLAVWVSRPPHRAPAYVFIITPLFTLTPGSHGLRTFESWFTGQQVVALGEASDLAGTLLAIAIGVVVGMALTKKWRRS
jgi:uncharacterized membrane protein YjjP (DUF1212 family)